MSTVKSNRRVPTAKIKAVVLIEQTGRCNYCNSSLLGQRICWDHLLPFAWTNTNADNNWVASCSLCNGKKQDKIFTTETQIYNFCLEMIKSHGSFGEGWDEDSGMWQNQLHLQANTAKEIVNL
jgi:hypothetical protein